MDETNIKELLEELLKKLDSPFRKIKVDKRDENSFRMNIESEEPSRIIGHHGETIMALQNVVKTILWSKNGADTNILLDVDDYRKRQEETTISLAERKVESVRKSQREQSLPVKKNEVSVLRRLMQMK